MPYKPVKGQSARCLAWVNQHLADPSDIWPDVFNAESEEATENVQPKSCTTFQKLVQVYKSNLCWSIDLENTLTALLAVVASTTLAGEQLWLRVIGPPSSGKSTLAEAVSAAHKHTLPLTKFTSVFSGWKSHGPDKDASPAKKFRNKSVIFKDADSLFKSANVEVILSDLRDLYDKTSRVQYGNDQFIRESDLLCTIILCGTDHLRTLDKVYLGERFIDCEITTAAIPKAQLLDHVTDSNINRITGSMCGTESTVDNLEIKQFTAGYINHLKALLQPGSGMTPPSFPTKSSQKIQAYAELIALLRTQVERDRQNDPSYRPRTEAVPRILGQLIKLALCTAFVLNKTTVDEGCLAIVRKISCDTINLRSYRIAIVQQLYREEKLFKNGLTNLQLSVLCNMPTTVASRNMKDLQELGMVVLHKRQNASASGGRNTHYFLLSKELKQLLDASGIIQVDEKTKKG